MAARRDLGRRALHRVTGSVTGVNWRPTRFVDQLILKRYGCSVCHVLPSKTIVLPCSHCLCGLCQDRCVVQDGGSVCPLDGRPFLKDECQEMQLPARKKQDLKAYCWNEPHGCDFIGPLAALLQHYEEECAFHAFPCQQCGEIIVHAILAAHYFGGCSNRLSYKALQKSARPDGAASAIKHVTAVPRVTEQRAIWLNEAERIARVERWVTEIVDLVRSQRDQLKKPKEGLEKPEGAKKAADPENVNG